jgi:hypothetical protein
VSETRGRTLTYPVPASQLRRFERRLAEGKHPSLNLLLVVADAEGNSTVEQHGVRIRR